MRLRRPYFRLATPLVLVIGVFGVGASCSEFFHQVDPSDVKKLREACSKLEVPSSFVKTRERSLEKPEVVIYSAEYDSGEDIAEIENFFREHLVLQGWAYVSRKNGSTRFFDFRRGDLSIVVEFEDFQIRSPKHFIITCGLDVYER